MKTFQIKALACFLIFAAIFAACEQEALIPNTPEKTTNSQLLLLESSESSTMQNPNNSGCGTIPSLSQIEYLSKTKDLRQSFSREMSRSNYNIPIAVHVVRRNDGTDGLTAQEVTTNLQRLNDFYAQENITFSQCNPINYINNTNWSNFDGAYEEDAITNAHNVDNVINIYYFNSVKINGNSFYGYTYSPDGGENKDIIMMANDRATNPDSKTIIHEMGHYFSLYHTHGKTDCGTTDELADGSNCSFAGDDVCDTPADPNLYYNCNTSLVDIDYNCAYAPENVDDNLEDDNGDSYEPDTRNIMSYSRSVCQEDFTEGQWGRVLYSVENDRNYLSCGGSSGNTQTFETKISHRYYDAEERVSDGRMNLTSTDLEFGRDYSTEQHVGLRFKSISIPQGTQICDAYIEFVADGTTNSNFTVEITGHDHNDASRFFNNYGDISNRDMTSADVDWDFGSATWTTNQIVESPDISSIVQEIINRGGWVSGNDMAFIFKTKSGIGTRRVYSYDHDRTNKSAKLVIVYGGC